MSATTMQQRELDQRLRRPAVALDSATLDVADLILLGLALHTWDEFEGQVSRGLALESADLPPIAPEEIHAAATEFRYAHSLVSANDFRAWLAARSLSVSDLSGVIRRRLLREREAERDLDAPAPDISAILWAEATCGGVLRELARAGADRLAAAHQLADDAPGPAPEDDVQALLERALSHAAAGLTQLGEAELRERLRRLLGLQEALAQLGQRVGSETAVERCLASHRLDWLAVSGEELALEREGAALEARLLMLDDGLSSAEVAARAHVATAPRRVLLDAAPPEASAALVATAPGEVAGPWLEADRWRVLRVSAKEAPSAGDPIIRQKAAAELLRDALDRALAGRVSYPQAL